MVLMLLKERQQHRDNKIDIKIPIFFSLSFLLNIHTLFIYPHAFSPYPHEINLFGFFVFVLLAYRVEQDFFSAFLYFVNLYIFLDFRRTIKPNGSYLPCVLCLPISLALYFAETTRLFFLRTKDFFQENIPQFAIGFTNIEKKISMNFIGSYHVGSCSRATYSIKIDI